MHYLHLRCALHLLEPLNANDNTKLVVFSESYSSAVILTIINWPDPWEEVVISSPAETVEMGHSR